MSNPSPINKPASDLNTALKISEEVVVSVVEALILYDLPWMGAPGLKQLWTWPLEWVATYFIRVAQMGTTFLIIDEEIGNEEKAVSKTLQAVIDAEKSGDADVLKKAIQDYANANSALIHADGSAHPL